MFSYYNILIAITSSVTYSSVPKITHVFSWLVLQYYPHSAVAACHPANRCLYLPLTNLLFSIYAD